MLLIFSKNIFLLFFSLLSFLGPLFFPGSILSARERTDAINPVTTKADQAYAKKVARKIQKLFERPVRDQGGILNIQIAWSDKKVNAFTSRASVNPLYWDVTILGGLIRHPLVTADALTLMICHELGHHLGGLPKISSLGRRGWSSVEGQSDYFASSQCFRIFAKEDDNESYLKNISLPPGLEKQCRQQYGTNEFLPDYFLCLRGGMAALTSARFYALNSSLVNALPQFEQSDSSVVEETLEGHPSPQCRLDTYLAGFLLGRRPLCWFKETVD